MKTSLLKLIFLCTLTALVAVACTSDVVQPVADANGTAARIFADAGNLQASGSKSGYGLGGSRAVNNAWNANDTIGVAMITPRTMNVINPYLNCLYVTPGDGNFSPGDGGQVIYFPTNDSEVTFKAYYPYRKDLPPNMLIPVSTKDQRRLAAIDLMTAEHLSGASAKDPDVKLHFHHRLAKVVVNLSIDNAALPALNGARLVMKGLKTEAAYDLLNERLIVDSSLPDTEITIPVSNAVGEAIVLPGFAEKSAGFEITTTDGGKYSATLGEGFELKEGHIHTFHIRLKSPAEINATIVPWIEGPERRFDIIRVVTGLGTTEGFDAGHQLDLFLKEGAGAEFTLLEKFTYNGNNQWTPATPVYWEKISGNPALFRGATVLNEPLNNTQMADILISKDVAVVPYTGVNLELQHAGAKLTITLQSSDGTFTPGELNNATVILPNYLNSGSYNGKGEFVPGAARADITPENRVAIFPPQTVAGGIFATVAINGRTYEVPVESGGFEFKAGTAYSVTFDMKMASIGFSAAIVPWVEQDLGVKEVRIGKASLGASDGDLVAGDRLYLFTGDDNSRLPAAGYFEYTGTEWVHKDDAGNAGPLYWERLPDSGFLYASITRGEITPGLNQSKDYITAVPVVNNGGADNTALRFEMSHKTAGLQVKLSSDVYSDAELRTAQITLPDYLTGGTLDNGLYKPAATTGDIRLAAPDNASVTTAAYLQPQTVSSPETLVRVAINGREYPIEHTVSYVAGQITHLEINIRASEVKVSVSVKEWDDQEPVGIRFFFTESETSVSGFRHNDRIRFYKMLNPASSGVSDEKNAADCTVTGNDASLTGWEKKWYRDDFLSGDRFVGIFPATAPLIGNGDKTFDWTCKNSNDGSAATNSHQDDVLVSRLSGQEPTGAVMPGSANVALDFVHVLSKITVEIYPGEGFTFDELSNAANALLPVLYPELKGFTMQGVVDVTTAVATPTGTEAAPFRPTRLGDASIGAAAAYEALVMPQTVLGRNFINIQFEGKTYEALAENASTTFMAGRNHLFKIYLKKTGILLSTSVAPWEQGTGGSITIE